MSSAADGREREVERFDNRCSSPSASERYGGAQLVKLYVRPSLSPSRRGSSAGSTIRVDFITAIIGAFERLVLVLTVKTSTSLRPL